MYTDIKHKPNIEVRASVSQPKLLSFLYLTFQLWPPGSIWPLWDVVYHDNTIDFFYKSLYFYLGILTQSCQESSWTQSWKEEGWQVVVPGL